MTHPVGRPLKFKNAEELQEKIDAYFSEHPKYGPDGVTVIKPITITGLALALDTTRETLCDYQNKDEFSDTIRRAKLKCEEFAEQRLYGGPATGPIFALKNFGWKDSQDMNLGGQKDNPVVMGLPENDRMALEHYFKTRGTIDA